MDAVTRLLGRIIDLSIILGAVAVALMMTHIAIDVAAKYIFGVPMAGTITVVSNYYMIIVSFLPLAFAERRNGHISVEVLVEHFPKGLQRGLNVFALLFSAAVFAALTWRSFIEANRAFAVGSFEIEHNIKLVTWPARYLLPLGCALMTVTLIAKIGLALKRRAGLDLAKPYF